MLEEENAFQAGGVAGVEDAENEEGGEVHADEVPEDGVAEQHQDEDF